MLLRASLAFVAVLGAGCAHEPEAPEAQGEACETHADCERLDIMGARRCGYFPLCIAGRCEVSDLDPGGGSHLVPCHVRDAAADRDD